MDRFVLHRTRLGSGACVWKTTYVRQIGKPEWPASAGRQPHDRCIYYSNY